MAQISGADARIIIRPETTFKTLPVVSIHPCEVAWDELVDTDVTATADPTYYKQGTKSCKLVVVTGCGAGDILATDAITAKNLSGCTKIGLWIRSSVALASGDLKLLLDETPSCASPLESIDIPAITEVDTWKYVKLTLANPSTDLAIISVGIKMIVDKGAFTLYVDDIRGLEGDAILIPFNTAEFGMQEALEDSNAIRSGRQPQKPTGGAISGTGTLTLELNPYHAILVKHVLGGCATTDLTGSKYQHEITIDDLGEGLAIEVQHTKEAIYTVYHCKGNTLKISQGSTGKIMMDIGYECASEEDATNQTTLDGDPTDYGHNPFSAKFGAFSEGGSPADALATNFSIDYTNNVEGEPTIGSEGEKDSLTEGAAKVNFSIDMLYKDNTYVDKAKAETESKLKLENTHGTGVGTIGNEYISIETPEVLYARPKNRIDGPRGLKQTFTGIAYYDNDAGGEAITITFKNAQSSIP
jgi:hypothetical protein